MVTMFPTCPHPGSDPVPFLTERFRRAGALDRDEKGALTPDAIAAMRGTLQSVVSGLNEDERPFRVVFGKASTASTNLNSRMVNIGTKAMDDLSIPDGLLVAIMVGLAYHEVAHINYDREYIKHVRETLKYHAFSGMIFDVHNIGQDIRIERRIARDLPGYADTLDPVLWFITERNGGKAPLAKTTAIRPETARNMYFAAVRAPWAVRDWTGSEAAREWGDDWATRMGNADKRSVIVDLIRESLDMIQSWTIGHTVATVLDPIEKPKDDEDDEPEGEGDFTDEPEVVQPTIPEDEDDAPPPNPEGDEPEDEEGEGNSPTPEPETEEPDEDDPTGNGEGEPDEDDEDEDGEGTSGEPSDEDDDEDDDASGGDPTDDDESPDAITDGTESDADKGEDKDISDTWSDDDANAIAGAIHETFEADDGAADETPIDIEDLEFPTCASDALHGVNDTTYQNVAVRIEKSREEGTIRVIRTPGWPDRKVRRKWDWNDTPPEPTIY